MIIVLFLIITCGILLFVLALEWYYCIAIILFMMFEIMVLNYESKIVIDRGLINQKPDLLSETLKRTFSNYIIKSIKINFRLFNETLFRLLSDQILL